MKDIVNKEKQKEIINQVLDFLNCDEPTTPILEYLEDEFKEINKNSRDIGLKDINGKSIYADSSIVEFFDHKQDYFKGYFTFNITKLAYEIIIFGLNEDFIDVITYCKDDITNLEIIDTIQENKLGLIKA